MGFDSEFVGMKFKTNSGGVAVIIDYKNSRDLTVRLDSGAEVNVSMGNLKKGKVKDPMKPVINGVGFIGVGAHKASSDGVNTGAYNAWRNMLQRCYSKKLHLKYPNYKDCTVCPEWHNFQNFADFYELNFIEGTQLDKDKKVPGNKVYSPSTCEFITNQENSEVATAMEYKIVSPSGERIKVTNMRKFCRENNLINQCMYLVASGDQSHHRGWTLDNGGYNE